MSHTPTPWANHVNFHEYIVPLTDQDKAVGASSNGERDKRYAKVIARIDWESLETEDFKHRIWKEEGEANAAFIVQACNAHDALVEALTLSQEALTAWLHQYAPDQCENESVERYLSLIAQDGTLAYVAKHLTRNRAAIALAQKGQP